MKSLRITRVFDRDDAPGRDFDFLVEGPWEQVVEECQRDFRCLPEWRYIVLQGEGDWIVWQEPIVSAWAAWREDAPPRDGTPIVAIGRVTWVSGDVAGSEPFTAAIRWVKPHEARTEGFEGWVGNESEMALQQGSNDQVHVDYWLPFPANAGGQQ